MEAFVVAIPIYDGVDLMDVAAPTEVFVNVGDAWKRPVEVWHVAETNAPVATRDGTRLLPRKTFDGLQAAHLLWTPGGAPAALERLMDTPAGTPYLDYLRKLSQGAEWVASVCEGALLLAKAGLLDGYTATTHWAFMERLRKFPNVEVVEEGHPRYVFDRNRVTGAGISAGLDETLAIVERIAGTSLAMQAQLSMEYFPRPPVWGTIPKAGP